MKLTKKIKTEAARQMACLGSNILRDDPVNGTVYIQFNADAGRFEFGGVTNAGMIVDYTFPYDPEWTFNENFEEACVAASEHYDGQC